MSMSETNLDFQHCVSNQIEFYIIYCIRSFFCLYETALNGSELYVLLMSKYPSKQTKFIPVLGLCTVESKEIKIFVNSGPE